ncbi:MAG: CHAT domain-containing protein [Gemmatimonadetes bacterium]|nr:CHAT domain-containing protein [Gemmatimonadota bacterium]
MKRAAVALILLLLAGGSGAVVVARRNRPDPAEHAARRHFQRAQQHLARAELAAYARESIAALRADPNYLDPYFSYGAGMAGLAPPALYAQVARSAAAMADPRLRTCIQSLNVQRLGFCRPRMDVAQVRNPADVCAVLHDLNAQQGMDRDRLRRQLAQSLKVLPTSSGLQSLQLEMLAALRFDDDLWAVAGVRLKPGQDPVVRARAYGMRALAAHRLGRHAEALAAERKGLEYARSAGAGVLWEFGRSLGLHGTEAELTADTVAAAQREHARQALALSLDLQREASAHGDAYARLTWEYNEGLRRLDTGDLAGSVPLLGQAIASAVALNDTTTLGLALMRRGRALVKQGELAAGERDLLRARALPGDMPAYLPMEVEHNLLHLYEGRGDDVRAETAAVRFIARAETTGECPTLIVAYRDLALFYQRRGRLAAAEPRFRQMVRSTDRQQREFLWAGEYYELSGQLDKATQYYQREWDSGSSPLRALPGLIRMAELRGDSLQAQRWARLHDDWLDEQRNPEAVPLLPGVVAANGNLPQATVLYEHARARAAARGQLGSWAALTQDQAATELRAGHAAEATRLALEAAAAGERLGLQDLRVHARALAELSRIAARPARAAAHGSLAGLRQARAAAQHMRVPGLVADLWRMEGDADALLGDVSAALAAYGRADLTSDSIAHSLSSEPSRASYRAARVGISNRALSLILTAAGPQAPARFAAWSARRKARTLTETVRGGETISLGRLQRALAPEEAIVDYTMLDTAAAALVITRDQVRLARLPASAPAIGRAARALRMALEPRLGNQLDVGRARLDLDASRWLYDVLLRSLADALRGKRRLYLVPDGQLHLLPFDVLASDGGPSPVFLLDTHELMLLPSLAATLRRAAPPRMDHVLVIGATSTRPAPGSEEEIRAIVSALAPAMPTVLQGAAATEAGLRLALPAATVVHLAVHAEPNELEPLHAVLHLEPEAGGGDGLMAAEITTMDFTGRLVVLSGCETAAGRLLAGEGVLNLSRALLAAGAASTVATLWPIGSATAPLMAAYYRALAAGQGSAAALRAAKLELRAQPGFANPVFWAPFVIITNTLDSRL